MEKILVIHTGGTISMQEDIDKGITTSEHHPLLEASKEYDLDETIMFNLPSPHITTNHMLQISKHINKVLDQSSYKGVVVTHGTDTLEETAYFLDLTVKHNIPVVITGAMRSSNEIGYDGFLNYIAALRVASSKDAQNRGTLIVMNDEIHTAKFVTKTSTSNVATFQSPPFGPIGIITKEDIYFYQFTPRQFRFEIEKLKKEVLLLKAYTGMQGFLLDQLPIEKIDGIIFEAFGQGNIPPNMVLSLNRFLKHNIPIVFVSRCFKGVVEPNYDYTGGGKQLKRDGVIFSNHLNGPKARIKLLLALENGMNLSEISETFSHEI
ncbi:asparaginase [Saliterribacillus persicus]|uniref:asparaginase n=1 Tax=Saliterribacillus persicus TaxID=930114 RepID=A0A368XAA7_9BACI|nr:asparaginase [Saliterribacillus persicus]RCW64892.1 asparaginase [Saliterribacillus persicus]